MDSNRRNLFLESWGIIFGIPALFILIYLYPYLPWVTNHTLCAFRICLNLDCPGCGITRSASALLHGDWQQSIYYHPLGIVLVISLLYIFIRKVIELFRGRRFNALFGDFSKKIVGIAIIIVLVGNWLVKLLINWRLG